MGANDNTFQTATYIALTSNPQSISDLVSTSDQNNYYKFVLQGKSSLNVALTGLSGDAGVALFSYDGASYNPVTLPTPNNPGTISESINFNGSNPLNPGTYYLQVFANTGVTTNYSLTISSQVNRQSDILWRNTATGDNSLWQMNGSSRDAIQSFPSIPAEWQVAGTGDFNTDGFNDILWRNSTTGANSLWLMTQFVDSGGNVTNALATSPIDFPAISDLNWQVAGISDFNGDGQQDIFWRNRVTGANSIWLMNGTTRTSVLDIQPITDTRWQVGGIADLNNDNKPDIFWRNQFTGDNSIWQMNGPAFSTFTVLDPGPIADTRWQVAGISDFTGDGKPDIFWRNQTTGENSIWVMNGTVRTSILTPAPITDTRWKIAGFLPRYLTPATIDVAGNTDATAFNIGTLNNTGRFTDTVGGSSDPVDYYRFNLTQTSSFNLAFNTGSTATFQLYQDSNSNGLIDTGEAITYSPNVILNSGTYFVQVNSGNADPTVVLPYRLTVQASAIQRPDLVGQFLIATPTPTSGNGSSNQFVYLDQTAGATSTNQFTVSFQIANAGNVTTNAPFRVSFYLSRTPSIAPGNTGADYAFVSSDYIYSTNLAAGANTGSITTTLTLPSVDNDFWGSDQDYYVGMWIDSGDAIQEISETNNYNQKLSDPINNPFNASNRSTWGDFSKLPVRGTQTPDLAGTAFSITSPASITVNRTSTATQAVTLAYTIANLGNRPTPNGQDFGVAFYLSKDSTIGSGGDYQLSDNSANNAFSGLGSATSLTPVGQVGSTVSASGFTLNIPAGTDAYWSGLSAGTYRYYIGMSLDITNLIAEKGGEDNNSNRGDGLDRAFINITIV